MVLLLGAFFFWMTDPLNLRAPKDQKLLEIFQDHRGDFEKLRTMVIEDLPNEQYFRTSNLEKSKLNPSRKQEYRQLLNAIWPDLIVRTDGTSVDFIFAGGGLSALGAEWSKGITYAPDGDKAAIFLSNLNGIRKLTAGDYLRPIESNWFLFYQRYAN